jgi:ATP-dependent Lon protease
MKLKYCSPHACIFLDEKSAMQAKEAQEQQDRILAEAEARMHNFEHHVSQQYQSKQTDNEQAMNNQLERIIDQFKQREAWLLEQIKALATRSLSPQARKCFAWTLNHILHSLLSQSMSQNCQLLPELLCELLPVFLKSFA